MRARVRACVDTYISTTSFTLLLSPPPPETGLQLNRLTYQLIVSSFEKKPNLCPVFSAIYLDDALTAGNCSFGFFFFLCV